MIGKINWELIELINSGGGLAVFNVNNVIIERITRQMNFRGILWSTYDRRIL